MAQILASSIFNKQIEDLHDERGHAPKLFTFPFTEHDVLELQAIFVTPGVHVIKTQNIKEGRQIVQMILNSLNYYHDVGCITDVDDIPTNVCDIISHILLQKRENEDLIVNLEEFFTVHPCFDFIWIEFTQAIQNQASAYDIKKIFDMYHAEERMPVVIVMYEP